MLRDAVGVVPYEPAQSLKHNDTRGKTVRLCHVNAPCPSMIVGGDSLFARGTVREVMPFTTSTHHTRP